MAGPCTRIAFIVVTALFGIAVSRLMYSSPRAELLAAGITPATSPAAPGATKFLPGTTKLVATAVNAVPPKPRDMKNYALKENGASVKGGTNEEQLIDGNTTEYTGSAGFGMTVWRADPPGFFVITLKEPIKLTCVRALLWDQADERFYRYKLEVAPEIVPAVNEKWVVIADQTKADQQCRSWQDIRFAPQMVQQIRLTGTFNSANTGFHVVELEAYVDPPPIQEIERETLDF